MTFNNVYCFVDFPVIKNTEMEKKNLSLRHNEWRDYKWIMK